MPGDDRREYPERPICGVGAVVRKGDQALIIRRGKAPRRGEWSIPGGAVEIGETLEQAVRREILEECSVEIAVGGIVDAVDMIQRDADGRVQYHYVVVDFAADWVAGSLSANSDAMEARWVSAAKVDRYVKNVKTRDVILKGLAMGKGTV